MGLFSSIIGAFSQKSSEKRQQAYAVENTLQSLPRLRKSAEDAGFNPLTALLATGGSGFNAGAPATAPLASASVIQGAIDDVSDIFTGKKEKDRARQEVRDQIEKVQLEKLQAGGAQRVVERTGAVDALPNMVNSPSRLGGSRTTVHQLNTRPVKPKVGTPIVPEQSHVLENYTTSSGETLNVPLGPDLDEFLMGGLIEGAGYVKKLGKAVPDMVRTRDLSRQQAKSHELSKSRASASKNKFDDGNTLPAGDWKHLSNSQLTELANDYAKVKGTSKEAAMLRYYRNKGKQ